MTKQAKKSKKPTGKTTSYNYGGDLKSVLWSFYNESASAFKKLISKNKNPKAEQIMKVFDPIAAKYDKKLFDVFKGRKEWDNLCKIIPGLKAGWLQTTWVLVDSKTKKKSTKKS